MNFSIVWSGDSGQISLYLSPPTHIFPSDFLHHSHFSCSSIFFLTYPWQIWMRFFFLFESCIWNRFVLTFEYVWSCLMQHGGFVWMHGMLICGITGSEGFVVKGFKLSDIWYRVNVVSFHVLKPWMWNPYLVPFWGIMNSFLYAFFMWKEHPINIHTIEEWANLVLWGSTFESVDHKKLRG